MRCKGEDQDGLDWELIKKLRRVPGKVGLLRGSLCPVAALKAGRAGLALVDMCKVPQYDIGFA